MAIKPTSVRRLEEEFVCQCHYFAEDDSDYRKSEREQSKAETRKLRGRWLRREASRR